MSMFSCLPLLLSTAFSRSILITGGTGGLGHHAALKLAREHFDCIVVYLPDPTESRRRKHKDSQPRKHDLLTTQLSKSQQRTLVRKEMGIQRLSSNSSFNLERRPSVSALQKTSDGVEETFAVDRVGHALLFYVLTSHQMLGWSLPQAEHTILHRKHVSPKQYTTQLKN